MTTQSKYNKSEIMKEAWTFYFDYKKELSFSECLKLSWNIAKGVDNCADKAYKMTVKEIFESLYMNIEMDTILNDTILNTVKNKSKGFQADIATKALLNLTITEKQAWCVAYEFKNVA